MVLVVNKIAILSNESVNKGTAPSDNNVNQKHLKRFLIDNPTKLT